MKLQKLFRESTGKGFIKFTGGPIWLAIHVTKQAHTDEQHFPPSEEDMSDGEIIHFFSNSMGTEDVPIERLRAMYTSITANSYSGPTWHCIGATDVITWDGSDWKPTVLEWNGGSEGLNVNMFWESDVDAEGMVRDRKSLTNDNVNIEKSNTYAQAHLQIIIKAQNALNRFMDSKVQEFFNFINLMGYESTSNIPEIKKLQAKQHKSRAAYQAAEGREKNTLLMVAKLALARLREAQNQWIIDNFPTGEPFKVGISPHMTVSD